MLEEKKLTFAEQQRKTQPKLIEGIVNKLAALELTFTKKPLIIGGKAMEYYGMRKAGADIDLIICDEDYQDLAKKHPEKTKDIWGDLGVVIDPFEIWRSIRCIDYDFYIKDAIDEGSVLMVSLDRLLAMRVFAMGVPKYMEDLKMMEIYYMRTFENQEFIKAQAKHFASYQNSERGTVWGGKYRD
jgi:hypothetical protein